MSIIWNFITSPAVVGIESLTAILTSLVALSMSIYPHYIKLKNPFTFTLQKDNKYPVNNTYNQAFLLINNNKDDAIVFDEIYLLINNKEILIYCVGDAIMGNDVETCLFQSLTIPPKSSEKILIRFTKITFNCADNDLMFKIRYRYRNKNRIKIVHIPFENDL